MNYEKMYQEALERAKNGKPIDEIFPELKESEDECIRKSIIGFITTISSLKDGRTVSNEDFDSKALLEWAAWLEKQDPQAIKEALRTEYEKGRADAIAEMQNPAKSWTEEDERKLELIKSLIDDVKENSYSYSTIFREMDELNNWVESFKNRAQPKQELKEDDIEITTAHWANA